MHGHEDVGEIGVSRRSIGSDRYRRRVPWIVRGPNVLGRGGGSPGPADEISDIVAGKITHQEGSDGQAKSSLGTSGREDGIDGLRISLVEQERGLAGVGEDQSIADEAVGIPHDDGDLGESRCREDA